MSLMKLKYVSVQSWAWHVLKRPPYTLDYIYQHDELSFDVTCRTNISPDQRYRTGSCLFMFSGSGGAKRVCACVRVCVCACEVWMWRCRVTWGSTVAACPASRCSELTWGTLMGTAVRVPSIWNAHEHIGQTSKHTHGALRVHTATCKLIFTWGIITRSFYTDRMTFNPSSYQFILIYWSIMFIKHQKSQTHKHVKF